MCAGSLVAKRERDGAGELDEWVDITPRARPHSGTKRFPYVWYYVAWQYFNPRTKGSTTDTARANGSILVGEGGGGRVVTVQFVGESNLLQLATLT
jgi:hypothetical protein